MTFKHTMFFVLATATAIGCRRNSDEGAAGATGNARTVEGTGNTGAVTTGETDPNRPGMANGPTGSPGPTGGMARSADPTTAGATAPSGTGNSNTDTGTPVINQGGDPTAMSTDGGMGTSDGGMGSGGGGSRGSGAHGGSGMRDRKGSGAPGGSTGSASGSGN